MTLRNRNVRKEEELIDASLLDLLLNQWLNRHRPDLVTRHSGGMIEIIDEANRQALEINVRVKPCSLLSLGG